MAHHQAQPLYNPRGPASLARVSPPPPPPHRLPHTLCPPPLSPPPLSGGAREWAGRQAQGSAANMPLQNGRCVCGCGVQVDNEYPGGFKHQGPRGQGQCVVGPGLRMGAASRRQDRPWARPRAARWYGPAPPPPPPCPQIPSAATPCPRSSPPRKPPDPTPTPSSVRGGLHAQILAPWVALSFVKWLVDWSNNTLALPVMRLRFAPKPNISPVGQSPRASPAPAPERGPRHGEAHNPCWGGPEGRVLGGLEGRPAAGAGGEARGRRRRRVL